MDTANSSYLAPFNVLSQRIKEGSVEANNNLKFLESITTPCQNVSIFVISYCFLSLSLVWDENHFDEFIREF